MNEQEAIRYIEEIPKFTRKHSLAHTRECLRRLGDPQDHFRVIHVAGTNGKGSTCAFLDSILRKAGYRSALFTSPHLVDIRERFVTDGRMVEPERFLNAFERVKALSEKLVEEGSEHPSYFEFLFLMGMLIFREEKAEIVVLETGLGGRLDATTAIGDPELCVITSIGYDHMQYLGDTLEEIAFEKAGILAPGIPVVYDGNDERVSAVIRAQAGKLGCPAYKVTRDLAQIEEYTEKNILFSLQDGSLDSVSIPFMAEYQVMNALLAICAGTLLSQRWSITKDHIREGIRDTVWKGRMETVLPGVIVDGAHNADGIHRLIETAERLAEDHPLLLVFSAVADKDFTTMVREMTEKLSFRCVVTTEVGGARQIPAEELAELFRQNGCGSVFAMADPAEAFRFALSLKKPEEILLCAGSLYLVGEIMKEIKK